MHITWNPRNYFGLRFSNAQPEATEYFAKDLMFYVLRSYFRVYFDSFTLCLALSFKIISEWQGMQG